MDRTAQDDASDLKQIIETLQRGMVAQAEEIERLRGELAAARSERRMFSNGAPVAILAASPA